MFAIFTKFEQGKMPYVNDQLIVQGENPKCKTFAHKYLRFQRRAAQRGLPCGQRQSPMTTGQSHRHNLPSKAVIQAQ